jgi:excisionase family DNA binding protein
MLTVPEAARRAQCDPETVRRWIRAGRLRSRKVGTQHLIEETDLLAIVPGTPASLPANWRKTLTGEPMPDVVRALRRSREGR